MKHLIFLLSLVALLGLPPVVHAHSTLSALQPGHSEQGGFIFDITVKAQLDGAMQVHVTITEKQRTFTHSRTGLGNMIIRVTPGSREAQAGIVRDVPQVKGEKSLACDFIVSQKDLEEPNLCFLFINMAPDDHPSMDMHYLRLKDVPKK